MATERHPLCHPLKYGLPDQAPAFHTAIPGNKTRWPLHDLSSPEEASLPPAQREGSPGEIPRPQAWGNFSFAHTGTEGHLEILRPEKNTVLP